MWDPQKCSGIGCSSKGFIQIETGNYRYWLCWDHYPRKEKQKLKIKNYQQSLVWFRYRKILKNLDLL